MSYESKHSTQKAPSLGPSGPPGKRGNQMKFVAATARFMCPTNKNNSFVPMESTAWIISDVGEGWTILNTEKKTICWKQMGMFVKIAKQTLKSSSCKASSNNCKVLHQKSDVFRHLVETPNQSWGHVFTYQKSGAKKEGIELKLGSGETCVLLSSLLESLDHEASC